MNFQVKWHQPLITKEFSEVTKLASNTSSLLSDAEVLVSSDNDVYRDLSFSASIELDGVILGRLSSDLLAMAKAPFFDKGKLPVIVANSEKNLSAFLDVLSKMGGSEKVSVLDMSLLSLNSQVLNAGLPGKILLVVDDETSAQVKVLNTFFSKSLNAAILFIDQSNSSLRTALTLPVLKDASSVLWNNKSVVFSNPLRATGVTKSMAFIQTTFDSFEDLISLGQNLTLSGSELIANMKKEINRTSFFTPNDTVRTFNLKALAEILNINTAYDLSGGIFGKDSKIAKLIDKDGNLLVNQLKASAAAGVSEASLSTILPAISMRDTILSSINFYGDISKKIKGSIKTTLESIMRNLESSYKSQLKKLDNTLSSNAYNKAMIQRPFAILSPSFPSM